MGWGNTQGAAEPQGFNVDVGEADRANPDWGAEAGQAGYWNGVGYTRQERWPLRDLAGRETSVSVAIENGSSWVQCRAGAALGPLLRDGVHAAEEELRVHLHDLPPGAYLLLVYAKPHCQAQDTLVGVGDPSGDAQCWTTDPGLGVPESSAFWVTVTEDEPLSFWVRPAGPGAEVRLAGFQLIPFGRGKEPAQGHLFLHEGVRLALFQQAGECRMRSLLRVSRGPVEAPLPPEGVWLWGLVDPATPPASGWEPWAVQPLPMGEEILRGDGAGGQDWQIGAAMQICGQTAWGLLRVRSKEALWTEGRVQRWSLL